MKATCAPENPNIKGLLRDAVLQKSALEHDKINVSWYFLTVHVFFFISRHARNILLNMNIAHLLTEDMKTDEIVGERMLQ